jgi:hypothetical protein
VPPLVRVALDGEMGVGNHADAHEAMMPHRVWSSSACANP